MYTITQPIKFSDLMLTYDDGSWYFITLNQISYTQLPVLPPPPQKKFFFLVRFVHFVAEISIFLVR